MQVTGTLAARKKWYVRHARTLAVSLLAALGLLTILLVALAVRSSSVAAEHMQRLGDARYEIKKSLQTFSGDTAVIQVKAGSDAAAVQDRLARMKAEVSRQRLQQPATLPLSTQVSASMKRSVDETNRLNASLDQLVAAIGKIEAAVGYQVQAANIIQINAVNEPLASEGEARAMSAGWQKVADELKKITPTPEFSGLHAELIRSAQGISAYGAQIGEYYKNGDATALSKAQEVLDDRYNVLRKVSTGSARVLESLGGDLSLKARVFLD